MRTSIATVSILVATVAAHGNITSPPARLTGPGMVKACGQSAVNNVLADGTIPLEDVFNTLPGCKLDLCRGAVFEDNKARVQQYTPGQVIPFKAILPIPHEGPANVSIVKTATNKILGSMLLVFDSYADEKLKTLPANNTNFAVTIPTNLSASDCKVAGECVLQWFWFGTAAKQTYESCVDFVMVSAGTGSAGGAGSGTTTSVVATSAVATSAVAATSAAATTTSAATSASTKTTSLATLSSASSGTAKSSSVATSATSRATSETTADSPTETSTASSSSSSEDSSSSSESSGPGNTSSSDSSSDTSPSAQVEASDHTPEPADPAPGSFGGVPGRIPEVNEDGTPAADDNAGSSSADSSGSAGGYRRSRRYIRPDDVTSR